jgi:GNAT superfamily N-acetyltransferase
MLVAKNVLLIRQFQSGDEEAVRNLHWLALPFKTLLLNGPWDDDDLRNIQKEYLNTGGNFLVGFLGNNLVCMGALRKVSENIGEIRLMRVHPDQQRKGFGQLVLDKLETDASRIGYNKLRLDTNSKQSAAQYFYKKNGYKETRRAIISFMEVIYFEKTLK